MRKTYKGLITELPENGIFVFGSNTQGRHGKGAALVAKQRFGAIYGQFKGLQGRSYAIVTKDLTKSQHPSIKLISIIYQIYELYKFAEEHPELDFYIIYSGNGQNLNGYSNEKLAWAFSDRGTILFRRGENVPNNIVFEEEFNKLVFNEERSSSTTSN